MEFRDPRNVILNLFLAVIPVALAFFIARGLRRQKRAGGGISWPLWAVLLLAWLTFLPNTCYLLTEWRHYLATLATSPIFLQARGSRVNAQGSREAFINFFLMTGFYVFYTGSGLLTFFLAVWPLERLARRRIGAWVWPAQALVFGLCALGVYLGLVERFNTWDLLHPQRFWAILGTSLQVQHHPLLLGFILGFGAILWLLYALFDIWMDGAAWRLHDRRARQPAPVPLEEEMRHHVAP